MKHEKIKINCSSHCLGFTNQFIQLLP